LKAIPGRFKGQSKAGYPGYMADLAIFSPVVNCRQYIEPGITKSPEKLALPPNVYMPYAVYKMLVTM